MRGSALMGGFSPPDRDCCFLRDMVIKGNV